MPGVSIAPDDPALDPAPTWQRIDTVWNVQAWRIDRGRPDEMSRTDTGTASIELVDRDGDWDPTNSSGAMYGRLTSGVPLGPMVQAKIELQNADTDAWSTLFRGFVSSVRWVPYRREDHANVTLDLVDGLAFLAACEMAPNGDFGDGVEDGNIVYNRYPPVGTPVSEGLDAVQRRINQALDDALWPEALRSVFTGNVALQKTTYAPRSNILEVIQEAADGEFPFVANVYCSGPRNHRITDDGDPDEAPPGSVTFHGRYARFNPASAQYDITIWQAGDDQAAALDADTVRVSPPLVASLDDTVLFTSAMAIPQNTPDESIEAQYVYDTARRDKVGLRTWSAENLATLGGDDDRTAVQETKLMADYVRDNYATPAVRVGQLTIKSRRPDSLNGPATWAMLCEIDISDIVHLTTTHAGGGGFDHDFYVEGIHYEARPGGTIPYVELTLDVSPKAYYDSNPFA